MEFLYKEPLLPDERTVVAKELVDRGSSRDGRGDRG